jgi:hypothetical protein
VAGITTVEAANAYLREHFIADYDAQFTCPPADPDPAFVALGPSIWISSCARRKSAPSASTMSSSSHEQPR